jgi:hypothetical protein
MSESLREKYIKERQEQLDLIKYFQEREYAPHVIKTNQETYGRILAHQKKKAIGAIRIWLELLVDLMPEEEVMGQVKQQLADITVSDIMDL